MRKLLPGSLVALGLAALFCAPAWAAPRRIGEAREFWVRDLSAPTLRYQRVRAKLRLSGRRLSVYVEEGKDVLLPRELLQKLRFRLEFRAPPGALFSDMGVVSIEEKLFAPLPTTVTPVAHLTLLFTELGARRGIPVDGYFDPSDQLKQAEITDPHLRSNEANLIYLTPHQESADTASALVARELQRLLAYHPSQGKQDPWYESILSEAALLVTGHYSGSLPVQRFAEASGMFSLVSQLPEQNGTQTLFSAFLLDSMEQKSTGLNFLTQMPRAGREAIELFFQQNSASPITFDVIFSQFLRYVFEHQGGKLPLSLSSEPSFGLSLPNILPYATFKSFPAQLEGEIAPYSFVALDLPTSLPPSAIVLAEALHEGACAGQAQVLWKPVHLKRIAVYAVGCQQKNANDVVQFRLRVLDKPSLLPPSPLKIGL